MSLNPLELTFEFTRSSREPFRLGEQEYLHRKEAGRFQAASLRWGEALLSDLAELGQPEPSQATVHRLGELLRAFLSQVGWEAYEARIQEALLAGRPVFLSFQFDADELYALPWEVLTLGGSGQRLAELPGLLLRYEWPGTRTVPLDPDPPKVGRILYAWSSAGGLVPSGRQGQVLRQACARGGVAFDSQRDVLANVSTRGLAAALNGSEPTAVLHLLCHGAQRGPDGLGLMLDASRPGGEPEFIDGQALAGILAPHARTLRLVVLSACQSGATGAPGNALPGVARALHQAGIQCVVASRLPLSVEGSVELTETLYGELLGAPCSLEQALGLARDRLRRTPTRLDWASLQLYARAGDGTDTRPLTLRPYRGLLAFQPEHSRFFFGREPLQEELLNRVAESHLAQRVQETRAHQRHRFQMVAGTSGSGKSSLVLAGLVAHLDKRQWDVVVTRPGEGRGHSVAKAGLRTQGKGPESGPEASAAPYDSLLTLWATLRRQWAPGEPGAIAAVSPDEVLAEARRMREARPDRWLLLVVDQFEEVFTQLPSPAERQAYVGALWALAEQESLGLVILGTLRVDYFGRCGEIALDGTGRKRLDSVVYSDEHRLFVSQLQGEQLQAVIEGPARKVGLCLDEGLVEVLVRDVGNEPGALPLLEYALDLLWEKRVGNRLTHRSYEEIGGVGGALTGAANRLLSTFSAEERRVARQLLVELVDFSDDASPHTRRRGWLAQLRPSDGKGQELFDRVLARLVGARLLVKGGGGTSASEADGWVEVAHESLIRRWGTLTEWVQADRKAAQERRELRALTDKWKAHVDAPDKGVSFLLTGYRLEAARHIQSEQGGQLAQDVLQFINESWRRAEARRKASRLRLISLVTTAVVVALLMTWLMFDAREQAHLATKAQSEAATQETIAHDLSRLTVAGSKRKTDPTTSLLFLRDVEQPASFATWISEVRHVLDAPLSQAVLTEHTDDVVWVEFSWDGKWVATGSIDGTARVWNSSDWTVSRFLDLKRPIVQVAFSPEGEWLVASTKDGKAHVLSLAGEQQTKPRPLQREETLRAVAFSPRRNWVVTTAVDGSVQLWRWPVSEESPIELNPGRDAVDQVAFNSTGTHVLMVTRKKAWVWQVEGQDKPVPVPIIGKPLRGFRGQEIISAALSADGTHMMVMTRDQPPRVLRLSDGALLWSQCGDKVTRKLTRVEFSPTDARVVLVSGELEAQVRELREDACEGHTFSGHSSDISRATFSPDGQRVLTASNDGTARVWSASDALYPSLVLKGHHIGVLWAAFSPDSTHVVTGSRDATARVWTLGKEKPFSRAVPHSGMVWATAVSPDGRYIASTSSNGMVRVLPEAEHGFSELKGHTGTVRGVAFSPDSQWLVTAGTDETVKLWSISGLKGPAGLAPNDSQQGASHVEQKAAAFSPAHGPMRVATGGSDGKVYFWTVEGSGEQARLRSETFRNPPKHGQGIRSLSFSSDGRRLITASEDKLAKVWDAVTGEEQQILVGHQDWVRSATFSPDDRFALTASQDRTARVWDLRKKKPEAVLVVHHDYPIRWAAFSPDGQHFATASFDGMVRVWSMEDMNKPKPHKPMLVLTGHEGEVTSVVYLGKEKLVTSSIDHTVRIWSGVEAESASNLREALKKEMDAATFVCLEAKAWKRYVGGEFPKSSLERSEACVKKRSVKEEPQPTLRLSAANGEQSPHP
jgi:WD40 repeat protein